MVFALGSRLIKEGDLVINYLSKDNVTCITVKEGEVLNTRFGRFPHSAMIGVPYGSKLPSSNGRGFTYLLRPTPDLWMLALPHRTQIVYSPDIAFIMGQLNIRPGSRVLEAGTGSGSFSHSIARLIGPEGKLYTFEFNLERFLKANLEFTLHHLDKFVTIAHGNVCKNGFDGVNDVDAVFLDLPAPWEALPFAVKAMRRDRVARVCCFSPCMEQVHRTVTALNELRFSEISMFEALQRSQDPAPVSFPPIGEAIDRLNSVETRKARRREQQIESARREREAKRLKREEAAAAAARGGGENSDMLEGVAELEEKVLEEDLNGMEEDPEEENAKEGDLEEEDTKSKVEDLGEDTQSKAQNGESSSSKDASGRSKQAGTTGQPPMVMSKPTQLRGHTSYLTFAALYPQA